MVSKFTIDTFDNIFGTFTAVIYKFVDTDKDTPQIFLMKLEGNWMMITKNHIDDDESVNNDDSGDICNGYDDDDDDDNNDDGDDSDGKYNDDCDNGDRCKK